MSGHSREERFLQLSISRSVAEAPSLEAGLQAVLEDVCEWTDWVVGQAWLPTGDGYVTRLPVSYVETDRFASFCEISSDFIFKPGEGIPGRVLESYEPVWFPDVSAVSEDVYPRTAHAADVGLQAGLGVPVIADGELVVVLEFYLAERRDVDEQLVEDVTSVASELGALVARKRAEDALSQERNLLEQMMEAAPVSIFVFNRGGTLERANSRALGLHAIAEDETDSLTATDRTFYDEYGNLVQDAEQPFVKARETGDSIHNWVAQIETTEGECRWLSVNAAPLLNDDGVVDQVVISEEDITQLKEQARRLKRHRDDLRNELDEVFARIDDAFFALDANWQFTYINERAEELLQQPREALHGTSFWEQFPEAADEEEVWDAFHTALETQEPTQYEHYSDTFGFWIEASIYPSETGVSVTFRDITERKERERQLKQHRAVTEAANDVIITIDENSIIQTVNTAVTDVFGYDQDELIGESLTILMPDELAERHHQAITRYLETGEKTLDWNYIELTGKHADGSEIPLAVSFSEVKFEGERFFTGVLRDIAERKEIQRQLEASNERLEQFAYAVSHDLQEPLRMVSNYLQLLENQYADAFDEDGEEFLEYAVDGAERMREMIDALLEYSRVETEGDPFEPVDLDAVLEDALTNLQLQIEESSAEITAETLPCVEGDASQLRQVFQNLLANAIEYSGDAPPRVQITAKRTGTEWTISVADRGIGIDPDATDRIFEVFQRLHTQDEYAGTGIGLALCRRIIERHGGEIWVESEPGEGSTFSFTLPAVSSYDM